MKESLLHFIWQYQYFDKMHLVTVQGDPLWIMRIGQHNTHAGADFVNALVRLGTVDWAGCVEIHIKSSDWDVHAHQHNAAYDNVVLHVVWQHDREVLRPDGSLLPTLELAPRINAEWLERCHRLMEAEAAPIPCATQLLNVSTLHQLSMFEHALMQRLETKAAQVLEWLSSNNNDWEETTYWLLMQNMGFKTNAEPMLVLAQQVPLKVLRKHRDQMLPLEALLFGQGGWLQGIENDEYISSLQKEHAFLSHKYQLEGKQLDRSQWKLLRMRPANFPTVRLAQMAAIVQQNTQLFSVLLECRTVSELKAYFRVPISTYWQQHYLPAKKSASEIAPLGETSINNIIINTAVPLLAAYSQYKQENALMDKALHWLEHLPAEQNTIIDMWKKLGLTMRTASDAQAGIEMYKHFCMPHRCLHCQIGNSLLRPR